MSALIVPFMMLVLLPHQAVDAAPASPVLGPSPEWKSLGPGVWLDAAAVPKRLILSAKVVLREGALEHLLCLKGTKEHEAILATETDPRLIHAGLMLTGAEPGHPVRFKPKFEPPAGTPIDIKVRYRNEDKTQEVDARHWIKDEKTRKDLDVHWVFGGSVLYDDPVSKRRVYAAQDGDLITVANFGGAMLDVPIASSADDASRVFIANTSQLPPLGTEVQLILSPLPPKSGPERKAQ